LIYIYLVYGLAFFVLGVVTSLQVMSPIRILDRAPLVLLSCFGVAHGLYEFQKMFQLFEMSGVAGVSPIYLDKFSAISLPISFLCLFGFGLEALIRQESASRLWRLTYALLPAVVGVVIFAPFSIGNWSSQDWPYRLEISSRLFIAFPGGLLAAFGLWKVTRRLKGADNASLANSLIAAAVALAFYSVAAGLIFVNPQGIAGFPEHGVAFPEIVVIVRALIAVFVGMLISHSFLIEVGRADYQVRSMRDEFSAMLAHDVRNILGVIKMSSDVLLDPGDSLAKGDQSARDVLQMLSINTILLQNLVSEMFDFSLMELHRFSLDRKREDISSVVSQICKQMMPLIGDRKLTVNIPRFGVVANVDRRRIEQVFINLLTNAGKYSFPKSEITVDLKESERAIELSVSTMGRPIPTADLQHLFEKYYRKRNSVGATGTGLGLFIVKELVAAHGGTIKVNSDVSGKTSFIFTLPKIDQVFNGDRDASISDVSASTDKALVQSLQ
jgi:signal transduction histidine kinase